MGKPVGVGAVWKEDKVMTGKYSDPYLMTGYDKKSLLLASSNNTKISAEVDISGMGDWHVFKEFQLKAGEEIKYKFPSSFQAYWIRFITDAETTATAILTYE